MTTKIEIKKLTLKFKFRAGTSRGFMEFRDTWLLIISNPDQPIIGIGECAPLPGLSIEAGTKFERRLAQTVEMIRRLVARGHPLSLDLARKIPADLRSVRFGMETAIKDYQNGGKRLLFETDFWRGSMQIPINGLVWMASADQMIQQVEQKFEQGFRCIKMKIGALDFHEELKVLAYIRKAYAPGELQLRVDANGAFDATQVMNKLDRLKELDIHSIEQPLKPGQTDIMSKLCDQSPIPVALDEELIGIRSTKDMKDLLDALRPAYVVLKPSLLGGFDACKEWIKAAEHRGIGWWITSALESNIGLNAISQFTSTFRPKLPQGLGTGSLYDNNLDSPLRVENGFLSYRPEQSWNLRELID